MKIRQFFSDDDAVSPVIGVILMVAITVILAAVIASFVLGLGDSTDDVQPNSTFSFDYTENSGNDELQITLTDGDLIESANLYVRGTLGGSAGSVNADFTSISAASASGTGGFSIGDTEISSGQGVEFEQGDLGSYDVNVVWETSDNSATLASDAGPDV